MYWFIGECVGISANWPLNRCFLYYIGSSQKIPLGALIDKQYIYLNIHIYLMLFN